ncbi:MAG: hypothetical protein ACRD9S_00645 [Pyrinomonadaceae bacterium]
MRVLQWISDQWRSSQRFRIVVIAASVVFLVVLLYPFETTTVPQWNLRIVDDAGAPVREINVTEHWQNYLLESGGHEEAQTTNQDGLVSFAVRNIRASLVSRLFARIGKFGNYDNRGRPVRYGAVVVWGSKSHETTVAMYSGEGAPQPEVRVKRSPVR